MNKLRIFFLVFTLFALVLLVQPFLKANFAFLEGAVQGDYAAYAQGYIPGCNDECSYYDQRTCSDNTHYRACGNYDCDVCLEWSSPVSCLSGTVCQNGMCVTDCTTHDYKSCYDNDVYWYDSCNTREDKSSECGNTGWTNEYQCSGSHLQRKWLIKGCSGSSCFSDSLWKDYGDCGSDSWTNNYKCSGDWIQREKNKKGCSGASCYNYNQWENSTNCAAQGKVCQSGQCVTSCVTHDYKSCYDNDVYWYDSCDAREDKSSECGNTGWTNDYQCSGNILQRKWLDKGCSNASCFSNAGWQTSQDCGSDSWINNYRCSGTQIQREKNRKGCSGSACYNYNEWITEHDCANDGKICSNGQCVDTCQDECSAVGQTICHDDGSKKTCGNYDADSCLEWSPIESILGPTSCGYGSCNDNQKPSWYCAGGIAEYSCNYDSSCGCNNCDNCNDCWNCNYCYNQNDHKSCYDSDVYWYDSNNSRQSKYEDCGDDYCTSWGSSYCSGNSVYKERTCYDKGCSGSSCFSHSNVQKTLVEKCDSNETCSNGKCVKERECTSGPCCDGQNYKSSNVVCKSESETRYSCPWGAGCGADVGQSTRIRFRYCSGESAQCDGNWGSWGNWSSWIVADYCSTNETCSAGDSTCNYNSSCSVAPITQTRQCYDNDVYWYNSSGARLSKYMDCEDDNSCTLDRCAEGRCYHDLKCDGTTCGKDSADYCSNCQHCGDGAVNCNETFCDCPLDVKLPTADTMAISVLAKKDGPDEGWKKTLSVEPGDKVSFLVIVASSGNETIPDVMLNNLLPANLDYTGDLKIDDTPFAGSIAGGFTLGALAPKQSKHISFDAKIGDAKEFTSGATYLSNISTVAYADKTISDSVNIEVLKGITGTAAAGTVFSQIVSIIGSLAFWLVILFILILGGIIVFSGYYWMKKKKEVELVRL